MNIVNRSTARTTIKTMTTNSQGVVLLPHFRPNNTKLRWTNIRERKVGHKRLLKLALFLWDLPRKRFNYNRWFDGLLESPTAAALPCGTTACALGWATTMPSFRKLGLRAVFHRDLNSIQPTFYGELGLDAAVDLFGLNKEQAIYLFQPSSEAEEDASARYVSKKIAKWVITQRKQEQSII